MKFLKDVKRAWKKIRFMPKKDAIKRTSVVLVTMFFLGLLIMRMDWIIGNGFKALSLVSFDLNIVKIIMTVIFSISALAVIFLSTMIKSTTKSFTSPTDNYMDKLKNSEQYLMNRYMIICSVVCFISAIGAFVFQ